MINFKKDILFLTLVNVIKVNFNKTKNMVLVYIIILTEIFMTEIGLMIKNKDKVYIIIKTEKSMKVLGWMVKKQAMEYIPIKMDYSMLEIG